MAWDDNKYIGRNQASSGVDTSAVTSNRDGTLLERSEFIIGLITGGAADLRTSKSISGTVEEGGFLQFSIGLMDIDTGAIASANIDITGITQTMERSRGGAAWSAMTAPVFAKADGLVYCSYEFLAAEWQVGDMYRLTLSGIACTIGTATAYVPAEVWSNNVVEDLDVKTVVDDIHDTDLPAISTQITNLNIDVGDYSAQSNLQSLLAALGIPDTAGKPLYTCIVTDRLDNGTYGLSALKALIDIVTADTQIRRISAGAKTIGTGATKYLSFDSGTNGAEIIGFTINGVVGYDWTVDEYIPTADAV